MSGTRPYQDNEIDLITNSLPSARDKCLFLLGIKTGFRISELLSIKLADCLEYGALKDSITVSKSKMKGKLASRTIPLSQGVQDVLKEYIETLPATQEYLFSSRKGGRISRVHAWRILRQAVLANKLKGKVATHSARKTFCEAIYKASNKDIVMTQAAMGHASLSNTAKYISFLNADLFDLIRKTQE